MDFMPSSCENLLSRAETAGHPIALVMVIIARIQLIVIIAVRDMELKWIDADDRTCEISTSEPMQTLRVFIPYFLCISWILKLQHDVVVEFILQQPALDLGIWTAG